MGACIVVACFIGFLFIYDYFAPAVERKPAVSEKKGQEAVPSKKAAAAPKTKKYRIRHRQIKILSNLLQRHLKSLRIRRFPV